MKIGYVCSTSDEAENHRKILKYLKVDEIIEDDASIPVDLRTGRKYVFDQFINNRADIYVTDYLHFGFNEVLDLCDFTDQVEKIKKHTSVLYVMNTGFDISKASQVFALQALAITEEYLKNKVSCFEKMLKRASKREDFI